MRFAYFHKRALSNDPLFLDKIVSLAFRHLSWFSEHLHLLSARRKGRAFPPLTKAPRNIINTLKINQPIRCVFRTVLLCSICHRINDGRFRRVNVHLFTTIPCHIHMYIYSHLCLSRGVCVCVRESSFRLFLLNYVKLR